MNPSDNDPQENERLQALVKELTYRIGLLFSNNDHIKEILEKIETEGYQVDIVVASLSPLTSNETETDAENDEDAEESYALNPFDYAFLQAIKVKP